MSELVFNSLEDFEKQVFELTYPIGSIITNTTGKSPETYLKGASESRWEKIEGKLLLGTDSTHSLGSTGGNSQITLTTNNIPAHTHSRGTMEIRGHTGWLYCGIPYGWKHDGSVYNPDGLNNYVFDDKEGKTGDSLVSGAFGKWTSTNTIGTTTVNGNSGIVVSEEPTNGNLTKIFNIHDLQFVASKGWTGETSSVGNNTPFNIENPYIAVGIFKRVS